MFVKLKWVNRNQIPVTTKIYRTEAITPPDQLTNPLATLDGEITTWTDLTVVRRKTYYYVFETDYQTQKVFSNPLKVFVEYNNGPGPRDLIWGDSQFGYYGTVSSIDFVSPADLAYLNPNAPFYPPANPIPLWTKWIRRGKILYVPTSPCNISITYTTLYSNGLVFGTDDNGPYQPTGIAPANQLKIFTRGFDRFIVRMPSGTDDRNNPSFTIPSPSPDSLRRYSEVADLIYPSLSQSVCPSQRSPKLVSAVPWSTQNAGREIGTSTRFGTSGFVSVGNISATQPGSELEKLGSPRPWNTAVAWVPVLEFIQEQGITVGANQ